MTCHSGLLSGRLARRAALWLFVSWVVPAADAQQGRGAIQGAVTDSSGALVPAAAVIVTNTATQVKMATVTNEAGSYLVPNLIVGSYSVSVTKEGFKKVERSGITLEVDQKAVIDVALQPGSVADSIVVSAEAPLVDTASGTVGKVVERRRIEDLPVNGRNVFDLVQLAPAAQNAFGASTNSFSQRQNTVVGLSINGGPLGNNSVLIDGTSALDAFVPYGNLNPSVDAIQEFKVQTGSMSAEYGYGLGGVVNVATRSGTNRISGSLVESIRNDALDANSWVNNRNAQRKSPLRYNQFGGTLGGPIFVPSVLGPLAYDGRDRTFFFFNYEGYRYQLGSTGVYTMPTEAMRNGDFPLLRDANCNQVALYNPATTRSDPNRPGFFVRDPFPGNVIPQAQMDPAGRNVSQFYPLPNKTPTNACSNQDNYFGAVAEHRTMDQLMYRLDHRISQNNTLFVRHSRFLQWRDGGTVNLYPNPTIRGRIDPMVANNVSVSDVHTFSPSVIHELRLGLTRENFQFVVASAGGGWPQKLGLPASVPPDSFPGISSGLPNFQTGTIGRRGSTIWQVFDAVTIVRGEHTIKAGADLWLTQANNLQKTAPSGSYAFPATLTGNPDTTYRGPNGYGYATLLLGAVGSASATTHLGEAEASKSYSFFVQEDWRATRRLKLNLGLRYSYQEPPFERNNGSSRFALATNPLTQLPGRTEFMGIDFGRVFNTNRKDFAPRFGFAYDLTGNQKTVLRGGYGIYYSYAFAFWQDSFGDTNGFAQTVTSYPTTNPNFPAFQFSRGLPAPLTPPQGAKIGPNLAYSSQNFSMTEADSASPMAQQWNVSLQRQMGADFVLDLTYSGNHGTHLVADGWNLNAIDPRNYSLGDQLLQQIPNPYAGKVPGAQGNATVTRLQSLRPYPFLGDVSIRAPRLGNSIYHALLVSAQKRYSRGFVALVSYTFSKLISDNVAQTDARGTGVAGNFNTGYQNSKYNRAAERAPDPSSVPHRFVTSATYDLPFGNGDRIQNRWLKGAIGGWQVNGILTVSAGLPLVVRGANNRLADRPDILRTPTLPDNYVDRSPGLGVPWFDPSAFVNPADWTFGNTPRTLRGLLAPGAINLDASLFKNFRIGERARLQFRAEAFNAANHVNPASPNASFANDRASPNNTNATFGRITSARDPRQVQLALKLVF